MELELGLKITHTRDDDLTSMTDFRITKDPSGPVFVSQETETKFILIGHLKGFRRENIGIEINEDGSRIAISGKKPVQEMVLKGWIVQKKAVEIRAFRKAFRIPDGVILEKIKAKFIEETSDLTIFMPKLVKGFFGVGIEEMKEEEMKTAADKEIWKESEVPGKMEETDQDKEKEKPIVAEEAPKKEIIAEKVEGNPDSGQVVEQAIDRGEFQESKMKTEEFPGNDNGKETIKEKPEESNEKIDGEEPKTLEKAAGRVEDSIQKESEEAEVKSSEENAQVGEQAIDRGEFEAKKVMAAEFPGRDDGKETMKEKPEESKEKIDGGEPRTSQIAAESVEESIQKESKEAGVTSKEENAQVVEESAGRPDIESEASVEKVEAPGMTEKFLETASLKPEEQAEREPIQAEESRREKLPEERAAEQLGSENHVPRPEITKPIESGDDQVTKHSEPASSPSTQIEEKHATSKDYQVESEKQEPSTEIQELIKPEEPCQGPMPEKTSGNEIEGEETGEENQPQEKADEHESPELEKRRGLSEAEGAQMKKNVSKKTKVCPPLVVAGSALLVSLIVLVFHLIRSKKR